MSKCDNRINIEDLDLISAKTAAELLGINTGTLDKHVRKYGIPHKMTEAGRIFFEQDILDFQGMRDRTDKLKHRQKG